MANIKFLIRHPNDESLQSVYVSFRFGRNDKLMYALPVRVEPIFWDSERERVKHSKYCPYTNKVNSVLNSIFAILDKSMTDSARDGRPVSRDSLKEVLDSHFGRMGKNALKDFHVFFETYINECDTRMNGRRGGQTVTYKTKREYARTYEYINMYERQNKVRLTFDDIDQTFLTSFVGFLQNLNLATNTIAHKTITIKALMRAAVERGLTENTKWQFFRNATEDTESVALNEEELERIRTCNLARHPRHEKIRDLFLMECWTGLRYSDIVRIRRENIQDGMIVIQQQKTNHFVTIPIHPVFYEIWERYGGVPIKISNQKFNMHLKDVCKAARINDDVLKSITKGGKKVTTSYKKWQLVSSHTGRRSFATNLYKSGFPSISIMQITGHRTETSFLKYIKVTKKEHALLLAEHWRKLTKN